MTKNKYRGDENMVIASTPNPPYYAVTFTSQRTDGDNGYNQMSAKMVELAKKQEGFLGMESARDSEGFGITISYWSSLEAIKQWKENAAHQIAQQRGKEEWYVQYRVRICKVEREYGFSKSTEA
jgi:heme-degrading monooxygenase HmoA